MYQPEAGPSNGQALLRLAQTEPSDTSINAAGASSSESETSDGERRGIQYRARYSPTLSRSSRNSSRKRQSLDRKGKGIDRGELEDIHTPSIARSGGPARSLDPEDTVFDTQRRGSQANGRDEGPRSEPRSRPVSYAGPPSGRRKASAPIGPEPSPKLSRRMKTRSEVYTGSFSLGSPESDREVEDHGFGAAAASSDSDDNYAYMARSASRQPSGSYGRSFSSQQKRSPLSQLPRTTSDFVVSGSSGPGTSLRRQSKSGTSSPTQPYPGRSISYASELEQSPSLSRTSSASAKSPIAAVFASETPARALASRTRSRQPSASQTLDSQTPVSKLQNKAVAQQSIRKRAKSIAIVSNDNTRSYSAIPPESAPPGTTFSSTGRNRAISTSSRRGTPGANLENRDLLQLHFAEDSTEASDSPNHARRVPFPPSPPAQPTEKRRSTQIPTSISAMLNDKGSLDSSSKTEPSLQELLGQVDVKGALALVREIQGNSTANQARAALQSVQQRQSARVAGARSPEQRRIASTGTPSMLSAGDSASFDSPPSSYYGNHTATVNEPLLRQDRSFKRQSSVDQQSGADGLTRHDYALPVQRKTSPDRRKRRLSLAGLHLGGTGRQKKTQSGIEKNQALGGSDIEEDPVEILSKISPAMLSYVSQTKGELELRYSTIYGALACGQTPPNPAEVARWRSRRETLARGSRASRHYSLNNHQTWEALTLPSSASAAFNYPTSSSLAARLRTSIGNRHPLWELYPGDIADFVACSGSLLDNSRSVSPVDSPSSMEHEHRRSRFEPWSSPRQHSTRSSYHQHVSSDASLASGSSLNRSYGPAGTLVQRLGHDAHRRSTSSQLSASPFGGSSSVGSGSVPPYSPTRSVQSHRSTSLTAEDALTLTRARATDYLEAQDRPPADSTYGGNPHSRYQQAMKILPNGSEHVKDGSRKDRLLQTSLKDRLRQFAGRDLESGSVPEDQHLAQSRSGAGSESEAYKPTVSAATNDRPSLSRHSSKNSSIVNLSKILNPRRSGRGGNEPDGHYSTDNDDTDHTNGGRPRKLKWRTDAVVREELSHLNGADDVSSSPATEAVDGNGLEDAFPEKTPIPEPQVIGIDEDDFADTSRLLGGLRRDLARTETLAPRVPPKIQIYLSEFEAHDEQRRQKGQLASLRLKHPVIPRQALWAHVDGDQASESSSHSASGDHGSETWPTARDSPKRQSVTLSADDNLCERPRRRPLLEQVANELGSADKELKEAESQVRELRLRQESVRTNLQRTAGQADNLQSLVDAELFQQLRRLEDHFLKLRYQFGDSDGLVDAAWAALSYVLRIFFWFSWIGVTILRIIKAIVLLPVTIVVYIIRGLVTLVSSS